MIVALCLGSSAVASESQCTLARLAEFPITMENLGPLMRAKINDVDVRFLVDSGAFYSIISPASAAELGLNTYPAPFGFYIVGMGGGRAEVSIAKVKTFTLAGVPLHDIDFLVGGSQIGGGSVGVLGQNVLHIADVEYDLGQGAVRLMRPKDCAKTMLAYWVAAGAQYSEMRIAPSTPQNPYTTGSAYVNGSEIRVLFDTGAGVSTLSLRAAARVGIKPDSAGVVFAGPTWGFGKNTIPSYIAPFASFKIGGEEIRNTRLRIADIDLPNADMLIGPDFFLSHRVYVANSQHKLYFSYNGGPVFNLATTNRPKVIDGSSDAASASPGSTDASAAAPSAGAPADAQANASASPGEPEKGGASPGDAGDYARRGEAFASRREFDQALSALTRACELAPDNPEYFYQRGVVYWSLRQPNPAMADFDQALKLKPDQLPALMARAELLLQDGNRVLARTDLDAADSLAAKQSDERYRLAHDYARADLLERSVAEFDLWIDSHAEDARWPTALNGRCWARALLGTDLALALKDCNAALKRAAKSSPFYAQVADSRGLVLLRMGDYDKSIADYDASLEIKPKNAWSLYGRGVAELRKQKTSQGQADIAQATAFWPQIADEFERRGIAP
ncbi:MAG TPA: aspartyl protease family protein [Steroidobacteraceae bacterium]|nr:aspartyl protease family protein [Steroidobacteraceae bacterium]